MLIINISIINFIHRCISGHKPHGDVPLTIRAAEGDFTAITCDTSYSGRILGAGEIDHAGDERRGKAVSELLLLPKRYADGTEVIIHGIDATGQRYEARPDDDHVIGTRLENDWFVKARRCGDKRLILSKSHGWDVENMYMDEDDLEQISAA